MRWVLALHVVAVISWMAGLLYLFRLYVYHAQETETVVMERLQVMERRLLRAIATPAAVVALASGATMLINTPAFLATGWMQLKLACVAGMFVLHGLGIHYRRVLIAQPHAKPHKFFRVMNEVPTVLMIVIVIAVIVRPF